MTQEREPDLATIAMLIGAFKQGLNRVHMGVGQMPEFRALEPGERVEVMLSGTLVGMIAIAFTYIPPCERPKLLKLIRKLLAGCASLAVFDLIESGCEDLMQAGYPSDALH